MFATKNLAHRIHVWYLPTLLNILKSQNMQINIYIYTWILWVAPNQNIECLPKNKHFPKQSMGLVYSPTWMVIFLMVNVGKYTIHEGIFVETSPVFVASPGLSYRGSWGTTSAYWLESSRRGLGWWAHSCLLLLMVGRNQKTTTVWDG